jgi:predicted DNA-binding transcriptional regulator YafY
MARNQEIMRQWNLLRSIEATRHGLTVQQLARDGAVTVRTTYRDLQALQEVGFPLYQDDRDGHKYWKLDDAPFQRLGQLGFSLSELCALYLSRRMVEALTGVPFQAALQAAFGKFEHELKPGMRAYLDQLPSAIAAMPARDRVRRSPHYELNIETLLQAALAHRQVEMTYFSYMHQREKTYLIHPYRLVYAHGALYLFAQVPEYDQIRTFAMQRVRRVRSLEVGFTPPDTISDNPFSASMGPNVGQPTIHVVLRFDARIASAVAERSHHHTQQLHSLVDGSLRVELDVSNDWWLHNWILGYGHMVTVEAPDALVAEIVAALEQARHHYDQPAMDDGPVTRAMLDWSLQGKLPFAE